MPFSAHQMHEVICLLRLFSRCDLFMSSMFVCMWLVASLKSCENDVSAFPTGAFSAVDCQECGV